MAPRVLALFLALLPAWARHAESVCGTSPTTPAETRFVHARSLRARGKPPGFRPQLATRLGAKAAGDIGNIAILGDGDGVVARPNEFNLDFKTLRFIPAGAHYQYAVTDGGYDSSAAATGERLQGLGDDDARRVPLPFVFPFFGAEYSSVYINSDGNLTFTAADTASSSRSLGRMTAGPPRVSPLFDDLDPSRSVEGVRVLSENARVVVSWVSVPEWQSSGSGARQTFQVRIYPDGSIEFAYAGVVAGSAVTGISPGGVRGPTNLLDFRNDPSGEYSSTMAERFSRDVEIDLVSAAQKFYATHEDSYDYLVVFNNEDIAAGASAVAYANIVRSTGSGFGTDPSDDGLEYGSDSRLQAALNLGHLNQYPQDPNSAVPARRSQGDTPLTILAHETGHLFLARVSVPDLEGPVEFPMLNPRNLVHWGFTFNSEASLLEGERIVDRGRDVSPEFLTTDTVQAYSPLDQYLMGFLPADKVPTSFWVGGAPDYLAGLLPYRGVAFDGTRHDVTIDDIIQAAGRRIPDATVAQRRFRFAFILIVPEGDAPSDAEISKMESFRRQFEAFFYQSSSGNATAETSLQRSLRLSLFPAAGVLQDGSGIGSIAVQTPPETDLTIEFRALHGNARFGDARIHAGERVGSFVFSGLNAGVEELSAIPSDPAYETAFARVQVADAGMIKLLPVPDDPAAQEGVVVRLTDINNLAYPGARILAEASPGGSVTPSAGYTDEQGRLALHWTPGPGDAPQLQLTVAGMPSVNLTVR